jgi:hypothetical protein
MRRVNLSPLTENLDSYNNYYKVNTHLSRHFDKSKSPIRGNSKSPMILDSSTGVSGGGKGLIFNNTAAGVLVPYKKYSNQSIRPGNLNLPQAHTGPLAKNMGKAVSQRLVEGLASGKRLVISKSSTHDKKAGNIKARGQHKDFPIKRKKTYTRNT